MNGATLTLGLAGLLAGASALSRRGSRATVRYVYPTRQAMKEANDRFFAALEEFAGTGQVVYFGPFAVVGDRTGDVLGKLEIRVGSDRVSGALCVHLGYLGVSVDSRNKGFGRRLLQIVCDAADKVGLPIELDVDPQAQYGQRKPPMNKVQLRDLYAKFGFKKVKGMGSDYMVRPARVD